MRFFAIIALVGLCLSAPVAAAQGPQPTPNSTASPTNQTAAATPTDAEPQLADRLRNGTLPNVTVPRPASTPTASPTPRPAPEPDGNATRIDASTEIVAADFDSSRGLARVTIRSLDAQAVTISSGSLFADGGGEGSVRTEAFGAGETATIEIPTERVGGRVGVVISTDRTPIYGHLIDTNEGGLAILRAVSTLQAWGGGILIAFVWMVIGGISVLRREDGAPEVAT